MRLLFLRCILFSWCSLFSHTVFIVCGEASGDRLAAWYVQKLLKEHKQLTIVGTGGSALCNLGALLLMSLETIEEQNLRFLNFKTPFEIFSKPVKIYNFVQLLYKQIVEHRCDEILLVDFPFINIPLACYLHQTMPEKPVTYLAPPALWVHGSWGIHYILKNCCQKIIVSYPFEQCWYLEHCNLKTEYYGYPFLKEVAQPFPKKRTSSIALFPGSRKNELDITVPLFASVINYFKKQYPDVKFYVVCAPSIPQEYIKVRFKKEIISSDEIRYINSDDRETISQCMFALTKPGQNTVDLALQGVPHIIIYKVPWWMYWIVKLTFSLPFVGLSNLIAQKELNLELLQYNCTTEKLIHNTEKLYLLYKNNFDEYNQRVNSLLKLRIVLEQPYYQ